MFITVWRKAKADITLSEERVNFFYFTFFAFPVRYTVAKFGNTRTKWSRLASGEESTSVRKEAREERFVSYFYLNRGYLYIFVWICNAWKRKLYPARCRNSSAFFGVDIGSWLKRTPNSTMKISKRRIYCLSLSHSLVLRNFRDCFTIKLIHRQPNWKNWFLYYILWETFLEGIGSCRAEMRSPSPVGRWERTQKPPSVGKNWLLSETRGIFSYSLSSLRWSSPK